MSMYPLPGDCLEGDNVPGTPIKVVGILSDCEYTLSAPTQPLSDLRLHAREERGQALLDVLPSLLFALSLMACTQAVTPRTLICCR